MAFYGKVREGVRKYFIPERVDAAGFRSVLMLGLLGALLGELVVYILLKQSADLGDLPYYTTDALIIGISSIEFLLCPFIGWLGSEKRRTMMVAWVSVALAGTVPSLAVPDPETTPDSDLCSGILARTLLPAGISHTAAVRLSLLLVSGLTSALARLALTAHGLDYLNEISPSDNLHMHIGVFMLHKGMLLLMGNLIMKEWTLMMPWVQVLLICIQYLFMITRLYGYPEVAPAAGEQKQSRSEKGLCRSIGRVLSSRVAMLQIIAMSLLAASLWGYGMHATAVAKAKYHVIPESDPAIGYITYLPILLAVLLAGYRYTTPVMPKYDRKAAVRSATTMSLLAALGYILMTAWLGCGRPEIEGLGELSYNQPVCGQNCSCDRPWMEFSPVCVPDQMATYFSPCHAGCSMNDTVNSVRVYSNCTCAPGGRATVGACDDGACAAANSNHELLFVATATVSTIALMSQITVMIESVDRRDVAVAVGLASGVVSLFAFVGAHGFYLAISYYTCAYERGHRCLLQNEQFSPWVGYSSAVLASLSMLFCFIAVIVLNRKKELEDSSEDSTRYCDRPWMEFSPVCVPDQMATYFSPCHAGCSMNDTVNSVRVYSNCTCAPGGRATVGACDDGACAAANSNHELLFVATATVSTIALMSQITVMIESVDRRDVAVAVGLASGVVSLFAFVGAHGFYLAISYYTCAYERGHRCLLQNEQFSPWVGYSSAVLASLSMLFCFIAVIVLNRKKELEDSSEDSTR